MQWSLSLWVRITGYTWSPWCSVTRTKHRQMSDGQICRMYTVSHQILLRRRMVENCGGKLMFSKLFMWYGHSKFLSGGFTSDITHHRSRQLSKVTSIDSEHNPKEFGLRLKEKYVKCIKKEKRIIWIKNQHMLQKCFCFFIVWVVASQA